LSIAEHETQNQQADFGGSCGDDQERRRGSTTPKLMIPQWYSPFWDRVISQKRPEVQTQWRCVQVIQLDLLVVPSANELDLGLACLLGSALLLCFKTKRRRRRRRSTTQQTTTIRWHFGGKCLVVSCRRTFLNLVVT
jgi:hypothetical protein